MTQLAEWWNGLAARERRTLILGGIALAIIFYVFIIWLPAHRDADQLRAHLAEQRATLAWMQQAAAEFKALRGASGPAPSPLGNRSLFSLVDQSARQAGLGNALRQVEPTGDKRVRVNLQQANFDAMIGWLVTLRSQYGVEATLLSVRATDAPGQVNAQLELTGGGA